MNFYKIVERVFCFLINFIPISNLRKKIRRSLKENFSKKILCRTACLGNFALESIDFVGGGGGYSICNHQKNRIDYCLEIDNDSRKKINVSEVLKYTPMEHQHLKGVYFQEKRNIFKYNKVKAIIIDSFSELTDQMFKSKDNGKLFCTHYVNVNHSQEFYNKYVCLGLLPTEEIYAYYLQFFKKLRIRYKNVPIIFINFPTKYDNRQKFKNRAIKIENAIRELSEQFNIKVISPAFVQRNPKDDAVYHFSEETYLKLAEDIVKYLNQNNFNLRLINKLSPQ